MNEEEVATCPCKALRIDAGRSRKNDIVVQQATIMIQNFPDSPFITSRFTFRLGFHKRLRHRQPQFNDLPQKTDALQHFRRRLN
jgi:hypothetical protein